MPSFRIHYNHCERALTKVVAGAHQAEAEATFRHHFPRCEITRTEGPLDGDDKPKPPTPPRPPRGGGRARPDNGGNNIVHFPARRAQVTKAERERIAAEQRAKLRALKAEIAALPTPTPTPRARRRAA
ncbi:MAG: hypothetical protein JO117_08170 [Verrucomicrobia bacterium]|nr:hypothetical protein [Verrucomicrobiota bacterium]MBV9657189.1 hypothetical protein [Verrucomicrobiota bacterium]